MKQGTDEYEAHVRGHVQMLAEHRGLALGRGDCNEVASLPPVDEREHCK